MKPVPTEESYLLILPDGRLLVRNVTPGMAEVLRALEPANAELACRAGKTPDFPPAAPVVIQSP